MTGTQLQSAEFRESVDRIKSRIITGKVIPWPYRGVGKSTAVMELSYEWMPQVLVVVPAYNDRKMAKILFRYLYGPDTRPPRIAVFNRYQDEDQFRGLDRSVKVLVDEANRMPYGAVDILREQFQFVAGVY